MTRYAVGDVQGCLQPLQCLLEKVKFDPVHDQLWTVGDMVNRGPQSLECLRFFKDLGASVRVVLGNHDLHLLAVAHGIRKVKRGDTIQPILDAPDRNELLTWLTRQPLFYRDPSHDYAMVHAGLAPQWDLLRAQQLSDEISAVLQSAQLIEFLHGMYGDEPNCWNENLQGIERWRVITNYFTRLRFCTERGELDLKNKLGAETAPPGFMPWFMVPSRNSASNNLIFGHWASLLGRADRADVFALDTGCVWGQRLTLLNLETQALTHCDC
ncbi:MAG: bis(5-nucleosyl)-tetraphosphatase, symmetrical [Verrucomicrobiaceae bacterium]|nr:bis(5-nucleosyl)-tetraphosphatase, symmetrical [Verrucomicrobiaceae bacterium]